MAALISAEYPEESSLRLHYLRSILRRSNADALSRKVREKLQQQLEQLEAAQLEGRAAAS